MREDVFPLFAIKLDEKPVGTLSASVVALTMLSFLFLSERVNSDISCGLDCRLPYKLFFPLMYVMTLLLIFFAVWLLAAISA